MPAAAPGSPPSAPSTPGRNAAAAAAEGAAVDDMLGGPSLRDAEEGRAAGRLGHRGGGMLWSSKARLGSSDEEEEEGEEGGGDGSCSQGSGEGVDGFGAEDEGGLTFIGFLAFLVGASLDSLCLVGGGWPASDCWVGSGGQGRPACWRANVAWSGARALHGRPISCSCLLRLPKRGSDWWRPAGGWPLACGRRARKSMCVCNSGLRAVCLLLCRTHPRRPLRTL